MQHVYVQQSNPGSLMIAVGTIGSSSHGASDIHIIFALQITRKGEHDVGSGDRGSESLFSFKVIHNLWTVLCKILNSTVIHITVALSTLLPVIILS